MSIQEKASYSSRSVPGIPAHGRRPLFTEAVDRIAHRLRNALFMIEVWRATARQRRALTQLDDRMLNDIGLSRDQVMQEVTRPFWNV